MLIPAKAQEKKEFNFSLNNEDIAVIGKALEERPFKEVANLIQKLNAQIQSQLAPAPMQVKPETKPQERNEK